MTITSQVLAHHTYYEGKPRGPITLTQSAVLIEVGEEKIYAPDHSIFLDENLDVTIEWRQDDPPFDTFRNTGDTRVTFEQGEAQSALILKRSIKMPENIGSCTALLAVSPVELSGNNATVASGLVVNGPALRIPREGLHFKYGNFRMCINDFAHTHSIYKERPTNHAAPAISHSIEITCPGSSFDAAELHERAGRLISFLGFVKGVRIGHGQYYGHCTQEGPGFKLLGFTKYDRLKAPANWFYQSLTSELPAIFDSFLKRMETKAARQTLGRALQYYKASNIAQSDATEVALLLSVAGLEAFATYILSVEEGWSKTKLGKTFLADKLREVSKLLGLSDNPIIMSEHLKDRIRTKNDPNFDGFNVLVKFRDGLIHPLELQYSGPELMDAWFASQWLLEVLILVFLGYRGKYQDRRRQRGAWAGTLYDLPLERWE